MACTGERALRVNVTDSNTGATAGYQDTGDGSTKRRKKRSESSECVSELIGDRPSFGLNLFCGVGTF